MSVDFAAINTILKYRPRIAQNWSDSSFFTYRSDSSLPLKVEDFNYWLSASEQFRYELDSTPFICNSAGVFHTAFFKFNRPLSAGETLTVSTANGECVSYTLPFETPVSHAVKYNQIGTLSESKVKIGYAGLWLGPGKHLDVSVLTNRPFQLKTLSGETVFEGPIRFRSEEQYYSAGGPENAFPLNGESVVELDFSTVETPGHYYLEVPGIGRSESFELGDAPVGEAFYIHMRGLYLQRCGIEKNIKFTPWASGNCHMQTFQAHFSPDENDYKKNSNSTGGYYDSQGNRLELKHFDVISATKTDTLLHGVSGGWHDAADYDRRPMHLGISGMLLGVYLLFPENFSDEQLNIPESGNGIPDIVDEAAWGLEVWRTAQNANGGVGCWIEAESHPKNANPVTDTQRYYLARPTRASSLEYAAYAAMLGNVYKQLNQADSAEIWRQSAEKAWHYALNPVNKVLPEDRFFMPGKGWISYRENDDVSTDFKFKAAVNLFFLTGDERYRQELTADERQKTLSRITYPLGPWFLSELLTDQIDFPSEKSALQKIIRGEADKIISQMESHAYRNSHFPPNHGYFTYLSWANTCPMNRGAFIVLAYRSSGRYTYRDKALLLNDWMLGANPLGRSMTSGLGKRYPVRFLSLQSYSDGVEEFRPGITPYTYMFPMDYEVSRRVYSLSIDPRKDQNFPGCDISILPDKGLRRLKFEQRRKILPFLFPVWRRMGMLEAWTVKQSEFTVWETIAPSAAALGALMNPNWKPSESLKNRQPKTDIRHSESFLYQP